MLNFQKWKLPFHTGAVIDFIENTENKNKQKFGAVWYGSVCLLVYSSPVLSHCHLWCFIEYVVRQFNKKQTAKQTNKSQWRSQNAEKNTHIRGSLLDPAMILFNCIPFQNGNFSWRKEFAPRGSKFIPLWAVPYSIENTFITLSDLPWMLLLLRMCVTCVMDATPMIPGFMIKKNATKTVHY